MANELLAHIRCDGSKYEYQDLTQHSRNTAQYAAEAADEVGLSSCAYLAGLVHDAGKATQTFQDYLRESVYEGSALRGSVNHTFAGVRFILNEYHKHDEKNRYSILTSELVAYAAGAHHGLFDCFDSKSQSGFEHRLKKEGIDYKEALAGFFGKCTDKDETDLLFSKASNEVESFVDRLIPLLSTGGTTEEGMFYLGLLVRLVCSAVIEGDRRDTAEFMGNKTYLPIPTGNKMSRLWMELSQKVDRRIEMKQKDSPINIARAKISRICRDAAEKPGGIFRLNVPTGSGKTLSSLRFALAHGAKLKKCRIIFVSPLLSILDQNADVIRDYIRDDNLILEHHSNVVSGKREKTEEGDFSDLLTESWEAPIIITTLVQLLNTLFHGSGSCVRRFHSICNSVIIIDEVQSIPGHLLSLFNLSISFLASACRTTVVLCSATQPFSEAAEHPIAFPATEMVQFDKDIWRAFKRTKIIDSGMLKLDELTFFAEKILNEANSLLIVCNKKSQSEILYSLLPDNYRKFYLSAAMCLSHRRQVLACIQNALDTCSALGKVVCVSTQVIEAGIDISFDRVIRLAAGMDSVIQSAGRCNRNGENSGLIPVRIVQCSGENLTRLPDIQRGKDATIALLAEFRRNPSKFYDDLSGDESIKYYYRRLYEKEMPRGLQDGPVKADGRKTTLFSLLSDNRYFVDKSFCQNCEDYSLRQAFKTAGAYFTVYGDNTEDVLVPYGRGREIIAEIIGLSLPENLERMSALVKEAGAYTVALYPWQIAKIEGEKGIFPLCGGRVLALSEGYYNEITGFKIHRSLMEFKEV